MEITVGKYQLKLPDTATVKDLKREYQIKSGKATSRQSFKLSETRLDDDSKTLRSLGVSNGSNLYFKDLGPQIGYRTVFVIEYLGPMIFVLIHAMRPSFIYGNVLGLFEDPKASKVAQLAVICWVLHFFKRELETFFVHKFSRPTMPLFNLFKNCAYYWAFGAVIGYPICSPSYEAPSSHLVHIGFGIFVVSEIVNFICHVMLSNMRPVEGSSKRDIPRGFLFELVCCPNYTFEVLSWVGFSIMTGNQFSYLFTFVGFMQMAQWAKNKHNGYMKKSEEYKQLRRKIIIPFIY